MYIANSDDIRIKAIKMNHVVDSSYIQKMLLFIYLFIKCSVYTILYSPYYFALWVFSIRWSQKWKRTMKIGREREKKGKMSQSKRRTKNRSSTIHPSLFNIVIYPLVLSLLLLVHSCINHIEKKVSIPLHALMNHFYGRSLGNIDDRGREPAASKGFFVDIIYRRYRWRRKEGRRRKKKGMIYTHHIYSTYKHIHITGRKFGTFSSPGKSRRIRSSPYQPHPVVYINIIYLCPLILYLHTATHVYIDSSSSSSRLKRNNSIQYMIQGSAVKKEEDPII